MARSFFIIAADGKLMAVDVKTAPRFEAGAPKPLFDSRIVNFGRQNIGFRHDAAPVGKRFPINTSFNAAENPVTEPVTVVVNWNAAVKRWQKWDRRCRLSPIPRCCL